MPVHVLSTIGDPLTTIDLWKKHQVHGRHRQGHYLLLCRPPRAATSSDPASSSKSRDAGPIGSTSSRSCSPSSLARPRSAHSHPVLHGPSQARHGSPRSSAIAAIGFFYILTLFLGLGAMTSGPSTCWTTTCRHLSSRSRSAIMFAVISAIAFATVLGTLSGVIGVVPGAVAHDLIDRFGGPRKTDDRRSSPAASQPRDWRHRHPSGNRLPGRRRLVPRGPAFAVAARANLPSIVMVLVLEADQRPRGIVASIMVGIASRPASSCFSPTHGNSTGWKPPTRRSRSSTRASSRSR